MLDFLQNQWVVGIGAGIISGIIVFFITRGLFHRKDNLKYLEQISNANAEIIRTLQPYIVEKGLPEERIIDAIISSMARKYKVKTDELYYIRIICEELISEVIGNVYVSTDKKEDYSLQIKKYLNDLEVTKDRKLLVSDINNELKNTFITVKNENRNRMTTLMSLTISVFTAILSLIVTLTSFDEFYEFPITVNDTELVFILFMIPITIIIGTTMVIYIQKILRDMDKKKRTKDNEA